MGKFNLKLVLLTIITLMMSGNTSFATSFAGMEFLGIWTKESAKKCSYIRREATSLYVSNDETLSVFVEFGGTKCWVQTSLSNYGFVFRVGSDVSSCSSENIPEEMLGYYEMLPDHRLKITNALGTHLYRRCG